MVRRLTYEYVVLRSGMPENGTVLRQEFKWELRICNNKEADVVPREPQHLWLQRVQDSCHCCQGKALCFVLLVDEEWVLLQTALQQNTIDAGFRKSTRCIKHCIPCTVVGTLHQSRPQLNWCCNTWSLLRRWYNFCPKSIWKWYIGMYELQDSRSLTGMKSAAASHCASLKTEGSDNSGQLVIDCERIPSLPSMTFTIAGKDLVLTGEQYIWKVWKWQYKEQ